MNENIKINYYEKGISQLRKIKKPYKKEKLLLHVCCGACSCYPLIFLLSFFDITILFSNSNIYPKEEFDIRLDALKKYVKEIEKEFNTKIKIIVDDYNYDEFKKDLIEFKDEPEHGKRCNVCIRKRMERLFEYASKNNFNLVTTVMSISRNKDGEFLNKLGLELEKKYDGIKYFLSDFKKNNGQDIGVALSKKYNVYRQDYCGCEFSFNNKNK